MTTNKEQKDGYIAEILERLGRTYKPGSGLRMIAEKGLRKLSRPQLSALYAMVITSTDNEEV